MTKLTKEEILDSIVEKNMFHLLPEVRDEILEAMTIYAHQEAAEAFDAAREWLSEIVYPNKATYLKDKYGKI